MPNFIRAIAWKIVKRWVRSSFPTVRQISTAELAAQIKNNPPLLIDARQRAEYAVSHLPSAQQSKTVEAVEASGVSRDTPIVVYCSIGYRSSRLAQQLAAAGYSAANLEGSLFQWANEGRPLAASGQLTCQIHPYSAIWGRLLESHLKRSYGQK